MWQPQQDVQQLPLLQVDQAGRIIDDDTGHRSRGPLCNYSPNPSSRSSPPTCERTRSELADDGDTHDFFPVAKPFTSDGVATWFLSEIDPDEPDIAFSLCDLGVGCPELGSVWISEIETARGSLGMPIERGPYFKAKHRSITYADQAREAGRIVA